MSAKQDVLARLFQAMSAKQDVFVHEDLHVRPGVVIPAHELDWSFVASGGPGGQHANRSATKAVLVFDVAASQALDASTKSRLTNALGPQVRVEVSDERSQWQNRRIARERMKDRLAEALRPKRVRRATRPSKGSNRRRLAAKKERGELKRSRQRPRWDD